MVSPSQGDSNHEYDMASGTLVRALTSESGSVFARVVDVPAGASSPVWEFASTAMDARCQWQQRTLMGCGVLDVWPAAEEDGTFRPVYSLELPEPFGDPLLINPGDFFRLRAACDMGVIVLAAFTGAPFNNGFIRAVEMPPQPGAALRSGAL